MEEEEEEEEEEVKNFIRFLKPEGLMRICYK